MKDLIAAVVNGGDVAGLCDNVPAAERAAARRVVMDQAGWAIEAARRVTRDMAAIPARMGRFNDAMDELVKCPSVGVRARMQEASRILGRNA